MFIDVKVEAAMSAGESTNFEFYRSRAVAEEDIVERGKASHSGYLCRTNRIKEDTAEK
jgi:hypothetical protein